MTEFFPIQRAPLAIQEEATGARSEPPRIRLIVHCVLTWLAAVATVHRRSKSISTATQPYRIELDHWFDIQH